MFNKLLPCTDAQQIEHAQTHYDGASIRNPILWDEGTSKNKFLRNKKLYVEAAVLETVQAGASWPTDRLAGTKPERDPYDRLVGTPPPPSSNG